MSADKGNSTSQRILAFFNFFGIIIPKNFGQAYYYAYLSFVRQNDQRSRYIIGLFYFYGIQVKQSYTKAREYFEQHESVHLSYLAHYHLALVYLFGLDVDINLSLAHQYYRKSEFKTYIPNDKIVEYFPTGDYYLLSFNDLGINGFISRDNLLELTLLKP